MAAFPRNRWSICPGFRSSQTRPPYVSKSASSRFAKCLHEFCEGDAQNARFRGVEDILEQDHTFIPLNRHLETIKLEVRPKLRGLGNRFLQELPHVGRAFSSKKLFEEIADHWL